MISLSEFTSTPPIKLERAHQMAEEEIIKQMQKGKENDDPAVIKIRMNKSLREVYGAGRPKQGILIKEWWNEAIEFDCFHEFVPVLDVFTINLNALIYILQSTCGFRVRAYLLYNEAAERHEVYLLLHLSTENLLRLAMQFRIKKEVDYTALDFFLNDPSNSAMRPYKLMPDIRV
ncbi:unnamed protein product [Sphagnum balticum]